MTPTPDAAAIEAAARRRYESPANFWKARFGTKHPDRKRYWDNIPQSLKDVLLAEARDDLVAAYAADAGLRALVEENAKQATLISALESYMDRDSRREAYECASRLAATAPPEETL